MTQVLLQGHGHLCVLCRLQQAILLWTTYLSSMPGLVCTYWAHGLQNGRGFLKKKKTALKGLIESSKIIGPGSILHGAIMPYRPVGWLGHPWAIFGGPGMFQIQIHYI